MEESEPWQEVLTTSVDFPTLYFLPPKETLLNVVFIIPLLLKNEMVFLNFIRIVLCAVFQELLFLTQLKLTYVIQSCSSFSLRSPVPLNEYTTLPVSEHLGCFQFIDIINSAALNACILIHVSWYTVSLGVKFAGLLNM